jgi:hypothetical protein
LVLGSVLSACVGPARTARDYRLKARSSARAASSALQTADLAAMLVRQGKTFSNYVAVLFDSAERDSSSVQSTFASIQPPSRAQDVLRDRLGKLLSDADDAISAMRIAARRHEWSGVLDAAAGLAHLEDELQTYERLRA